MAVHPHFLDRIPLLASLPAGLRERLGAAMRRVELPRRAVALEKDAQDQPLGFVLGGRLQAVDFTRDGREVGLYFVSPGEFFGELSAIDGQPAPEHVIAIVKSELLLLPRREAQALLAEPSIARAFALRLAERVRLGIRQRSWLALPNPQQRLAALLADLAAEGVEITPCPTHQELAIMINTTRETVTRLFQQLTAQGVLRRDGERLLVAYDRLARLATGEAWEGRSAPPFPTDHTK